MEPKKWAKATASLTTASLTVAVLASGAVLQPPAARAGLLTPLLQLMRPQLEERLARVCVTMASGGDKDLERSLQDPCRQLAGPTSRCLVEETDRSGRGLGVLTELIGGRVHMMFSNLLTSMPHVRSGRLRAIAVSTAKRSPQAPELPTVAESGVPGFDVTPWYGALGPAQLPAAITQRLNTEIAAIVKTPEMHDRFVAQGVDLASSTPQEFLALIKSEVPRWRKIVMDSGAKVD